MSVRRVDIEGSRPTAWAAAGVIRRDRLVDGLCAWPRPPLALISGPAGWGKTTLAGQVVDRRRADGEAVAWLTCEAGDDAHAIVADLLSASRAAAPDLESLLAPLSLPPDATDLSAAVDLVGAAVETAGCRLTVVIDDAHLLADPGALGLLTRFLSRLPDGISALVTGRHDPALPWHRWRMAGSVREVRIAELAATAAEVQHLLRGIGLALDRAEIGQILRITEGWIGGVRLAGQAILTARSRQEALQRITGPGGTLPGYLLEQVIGQLPEPTQRFLQDVSIVNPIPVGLAERLTGRRDALGLLREAARRTGFIAATDQTEGAFRAHQLLSSALQDEVAPQDRLRLHRTAAVWFLEHHDAAAAIGQYLLAQDWSAAKEQMLQNLSRMVAGGRVSTVRRLPPSMIDSDPELAVAVLATRAWSADFTRLADLLPVVDRGLHDLDRANPAGGQWVRLMRGLVTMSHDRVTGNFSGMLADLDRLTADQVVSSAPRPAHSMEQTVIASNRGTGLLWLGELDRAREMFDFVLAGVTHLGFSIPALNCMAHSSWIDLMDGRLGAAHERASGAVAQAQRRAWTTVRQVAVAHACLAAIAVERADLAAARTELVRAERAWRPQQELAIGLLIGELQARLLTATGRPEEALALLHALRLNPGTTPSTEFLTRGLGCTKAEAAAAAGQHALAADLLDRHGVRDLAVRGMFAARRHVSEGDPQAAVQVLGDPSTQVVFGRDRALHLRRLLWLARAHQLTGSRQRAVAGICAALDIARHDRYRLPFLELGGHARPLLDLPRADELGARSGFVADLAGSIPDPGAWSASGSGPVDLTRRERELLALLPGRMTNDDIARHLYVSVNTVKTHTRSIYRKLSATNRRTAVQRAQDLGLL